ncbi:methyl-accepting chemotaxis sensory transducer [Magnetococcus marinus MC-1]|uniref:Methyl-accepting chemotaxis sensory transducer n=1 Tax=Magnetococcus marinus (strain ATCC BAA-1437 / JCM 17883 / MC-1) TaxID=156889 RepID=A0LA98_MAGMM|nr:methyl-accepting chemotaxis protein [Magnetococcus marinus]ABK44891.1 methyl-accepting chemotaxis sensory transducer [Magnetococcus marinus MC-1]
MIKLNSLDKKIMLGVGLVGFFALLSMGGFAIYKMEKAVLFENTMGVNKLTSGVINGLESIMLSGNSELARDLAQRLSKMEDVRSFRILRLDGQEAFVEGQEAPEDAETGWVGFRHFDATKVSPLFASAVENKQEVSFDHTDADGGRQRSYLVPILNKEPCQACHGDQHDVRGVLKITVSTEEMISNISQTRLDLALMLTISIILFLVLLKYILKFLIINPVNTVKAKMRDFAEGENPDLTQKLDFTSNDEIGELVYWFNQFLGVISEIVENVKGSAVTLDQLALILNQASEHMSAGIDSVQTQTISSTGLTETMRVQMEDVSRATMGIVALLESSVERVTDVNQSMVTIAAAAEEANTNLRHVADSSDSMSQNMSQIKEAANRSNENFDIIASSVTSLGDSFQKVRSRCKNALHDAGQAVELSLETSQLVQHLEEATETISRTVGEIRQIADQTNMLALNASIEAAGAGQAGLGFAVVANEVKQLASRTAQATVSITKDTKSIQERTKKAIQATERVAEMIQALGDSNRKITDSVDEQNQALDEISLAISQSAKETIAVTNSINATSEGISETARNVNEISYGMDEVTRSVAIISSHVNDLANAVKNGARQGKDSIGTVMEVAKSSQMIVEAMEAGMQSAEGIQVLSNSVRQHAKTLSDLGKTLNNQLARFICG